MPSLLILHYLPSWLDDALTSLWFTDFYAQGYSLSSNSFKKTGGKKKKSPKPIHCSVFANPINRSARVNAFPSPLVPSRLKGIWLGAFISLF